MWCGVGCNFCSGGDCICGGGVRGGSAVHESDDRLYVWYAQWWYYCMYNICIVAVVYNEQ